MSTEPTVFLNGEFLPASQAKLNIYDLGIVLGATLTEMTRTFAHRPFRLEDHVSRLYRSLKYSGIDPGLSPKEMITATEQLAAHNCALLPAGDKSGSNSAVGCDLGIVHFVTPGEVPLYAGSAGGTANLRPTVCIHSFPLRFSMWREQFTTGTHVVTPSIRHVPPQCVDPKMKNRSRLHWFLADRQSQAVDPKAASLLLDLDGNITECGGSNFVVISGKTIYSPTTRNILSGVSLGMVRELAPKLGLSFVEKGMQPYDVVNADEAWLTTTPYCVAPCTKINKIPIGEGVPGPVWRRMLDAWSEAVGLDILQQIMESPI